ncbi:aldolase/citrate lyase family protein [Rhodoblastus sp.]|uniref:aldolase/citrate lyase family protein n=1 Tax=Rhodoblastus sp. TaxID=1962975 RepID=UPI003F967983
MRSILVVPAARPSARGALASEADAIALDLAGDDDDEARRAAIELLGLAQAIGKTALVMIRPLASGRADADLDAVMTAKPRAIVLPDAIGGRDVQHLGAKLAVREAENDLPDGSTGILALAADSPAAIFELGALARATRRLIGIGRDERRLAQSLGLAIGGEEKPEPLRVARGLAILAAGAAGAPAFDSAEPGEGEAFARACARAARDGFSGKFALTPDQARAINAAFPARACSLNARSPNEL